MPVLRSHWMVMVVVGSLALNSAGCGGDGAKSFGGGDAGGIVRASGGANGASGGRIGATGGDTAASGGQGGAAGGVSASGGANATGGTGTGGVIATGGASGSGGPVGSGGGTGGGGPGTGGAAVGTGGAGSGSTGGRVGSGGAGSGGRTGTGGAAAMCDALAADYQSALPAAKACNTITGLTVPQCQTMASASLGCGSTCIIYVQDSAKLIEIHNRWSALACQSMIGACPAIACIDGKPGNCYASTGSTTAQCQIVPK